MKIDRSKVKKGTSEVPEDCRKIIQYLKTCTKEQLLQQLQEINVWYFGKCELYHWIDVLDRFDTILSGIAKPVDGKKWVFEFDLLEESLGKEKGSEEQNLIFQILKFTALLIEHSYARHLYNSIEHLITLLDCADGNIILAVLNLIYVFSKRSNYLSRLPSERKKLLQEKLFDLAQTWGGSEAGCALEQCCSQDVPAGAGNVYFEYYLSDDHLLDKEKSVAKLSSNRVSIDLKNVHQLAYNAGIIMENVLKTKKIPENMQMSFYHRLRLAHAMASYERRLQYVQARLQALSILVYSNATLHVNTLVYDGLIEEIVNTLKIEDNTFKLAEVKASCLKTLTAIIHLDRNPRLQSIIDATGATSYHGFLPSMVRQCILHMTNTDYETFPQQLATALFSFLYHLASYESGCEALVASGLIESLLKVVHWPGQDDHITFVTRAVRVIDLITNLDMAAFQTHNGLNALVSRLEREIKLCSDFHGKALAPELPIAKEDNGTSDDIVEDIVEGITSSEIPKDKDDVNDVEMKDVEASISSSIQVQCLPQRAALLKSILNFLKKAIPDPAFADYTRSLMDENLQNALKLIISNAEYYGALLFLLATDVITVFIFHEPSLLSSLQESGLTWVVLRALIVKDVPATRENLASLPNTLSALCLNTRGLEAFVSCKPFDRLFRILISPEYLPAMKRRRSSDPSGDTAMHLGSAMDELMRHQPTLKTDAMSAIIRLLERLGEMGRDPNIIAFHPTDKIKTGKSFKNESETTETTANDDPISDDDEEEYRSVLIRKSDQKTTDIGEGSRLSEKKTYVPLVDYVLNVTKFLDNILSNNGTDDHCVEFVRLNGLKPLYGLLNMPNFPLEFPLMPACQSIAPVCKSIAMLAQESKVFEEGLEQLNVLLDKLDTYYTEANTTGSVLLKELANTDNPVQALYDSKKTPMVHLMSTIHAYVNTFVFISRGALSEVRNMSIQQWGSELGTKVLEKICTLYTKLVWESSILLSLCTPNASGRENALFAEEDLAKLESKSKIKQDPSASSTKKEVHQILPKWLLTSSSHLGRALAELFGLLVQQSVGSQASRMRRPLQNMNQPAVPSVPARAITSRLTSLLVQGLEWKCPDDITIPQLRLTFYICSVGFASPMLFDTKNAYHLMLQQFQTSSGLDALFSRFRWVVYEYLDGKTEEEIQNAVGVREFLEGWLQLINRMVNTKYVFESTHALPTVSPLQHFTPFDSVAYLAQVHKLAFESIMLLWKMKTLEHSNSNVIADLMLSILSHIIKGEDGLIQKFLEQDKQREKKDKMVLPEVQKTPAPTTFQQVEVNQEHLQQFIDMGFPEQRARQALVQSSNNFESATEYLLYTPEGTGLTTSAATGTTASARMEVDMSEEDMMIQAIAMSLGQGMAQQEATKSKGSKAIGNERKLEVKKSLPTLTWKDLDDFSKTITDNASVIVTGCLELVYTIPNAVHTVCDLLLAIAQRSGSEMYMKMLNDVVKDILESTRLLKLNIQHVHDLKGFRNVVDIVNRRDGCPNLSDSEKKEILDGKEEIEKIKEKVKIACSSPYAVTLTTRLHLYLLLFQELELSCAHEMENHGSFVELIELLEQTTKLLQVYNVIIKDTNEQLPSPDFLAPLLLIFDQYEKAALFSSRRKNQNCSHTWKWFDDRSGRWCNYSVSNNTSIDNAYLTGETTVRFSAGRRRYMVFFKTLVQINEDTGNRRPIMMDVMQEDPDDNVNSGSSSKKTDKPSDKVEKQTSKAVKRKHDSDKSKMEVEDGKGVPQFTDIIGLYAFQKELITESMVELLGFPVNSAALNAVIRLALRFTRDSALSHYFAELNGVENLLNLKDSSSFPGAMPLITLLLRHIVEDEETMKVAVQRAVAVAANNGVPNLFCGVGQNSLGAKELHYLLRALGPIACRDAKLYEETVRKVFRLGLPGARRGQLEEVIPANSAQIIKVPQELKLLGLSGAVVAHPDMKKFVHLLLGTLIERHFSEAEQAKTMKEKTASVGSTSGASTKVDAKRKSTVKLSTPQATLVRRLTGEHIDEDDITTAVQQSSSNDPEVKASVESLNDLPEKPLLTQAIILLLLTELAKSYSAVASLIVDYTTGLKGDEKFQGSMLAFIFDNLLPHTNSKETKEKTETSATSKENKSSTVSTLARSLLSVLGAYWHNSDIINTFVGELKNALLRALQLPECKIKHQRLQSLFNLITSMIEFAAPVSFSSQPPLQNSSFIKMLIKRGLISDLARCTHNLDLSSHDLVATINVMLKPLEKLSNLANSQSMQSSKTDKDHKQLSAVRTEQSTDTQQNDTLVPQTSSSTDNARQEALQAIAEPLQDLEDIVGEFFAGNGEPEIFGDSLIHESSGNGSVEQRLFIGDTNVLARDSSDSSDSDDTEDGATDSTLRFDEEINYPENQEPLFTDETDPDNPLVTVGVGNSQGIQDTTQSSQEDVNGETSTSERQLTATYDIIEGREIDDSSFMITENNGDDILGNDDDDEDTDDEDGNDDDEDDDEDDDDDDDGSEMDADDTIANAEDVMIFGDEDEEENQNQNNPFADLDDSNTLEITFPRRPFNVHVPQLNSDNLSSTGAQSRGAAILSHPLLLRTPDQLNSQATASSSTTRGGRGNRRTGVTRQGNTIHVHSGPNSGSFARILIGEDLRSGVGRNGDYGGLAAGDDLFFDIFGDGNETNSGLLNSIPNALSRWTVESRLLDGASVHDCVNKLKPPIVKYLEKLQKEELQQKIAEEKLKKEEAERKKQQTSKSLTENTTSSVSSSVTTTTATTGATTAVSSMEVTSSSITTPSEGLSLTTNSTTLVSSITSSQAQQTSSSGLSEAMDTSESQPLLSQAASSLDFFSATSVLSHQPSSVNMLATPTNPQSVIPSPPTTNNVRRARGTWIPPVGDTPTTQPTTDNPATFITPVNPLPEVIPNAPERALHAELTSNTHVENTPVAVQPNVDIQSILGVAPTGRRGTQPHETPADLPRLSQVRNNQGLTGDLGFTPMSNVQNTPMSDLPSMSSIHTTPADVPSLSQLRNNLLFSQEATPRSVHPRSSHLTQPRVPSPLVRSLDVAAAVETTSTENTSETAMSVSVSQPSSVLASDLAAAIMSQLVTSSPTPAITMASNTLDVTSAETVLTTADSTVVSSTGMIQTTNSATSETNTTLLTTTATTADSSAMPSSSTGVLEAAEQIQRELEGLGIPEGVDPSFLAALPDNIREEVLRDQFGIRLRSGTDSNAAQPSNVETAANAAASDEPQEVSAEFLAALPPEVQAEVLEQQRLEQARFTAAQQRPEEAVDPAEFVRNLNPILRRQVLADMDDSVLAVLPPELSSEAQGLRNEIEQRRMQTQAERSITRSDFSQLLRHTGLAHRTPAGGFQFARLIPRGPMGTWRVTDGPSNGAMGNKKVGRQLLDPESLTCLLVLLFLNDNTLNATRLHRILRNLSYHSATKQWIILALISILRRTSSFHQETTSSSNSNTQLNQTPVSTKTKQNFSQQKEQDTSLVCQEIQPTSSITSNYNQWLSRTLNLAFGGCVNIFQLQKVGRKASDYFVTVHQQACLDVCKQTLEALSFLAKNFPSSFAPLPEQQENKDEETAGCSTYSKEYQQNSDQQSEFWDILIALNSTVVSMSTSGKGKAPLKSLREFPKNKQTTSFVTSPLGQILSMLSHPVVKQSTMLTDKLLRLLAVISVSLPERPKHLQAQPVSIVHESGPNAQPPEEPVLPPDIQHHTVTFADTDSIVLPDHAESTHQQSSDEERYQHAAEEVGTVCSETTSVTSSLLVEPPEVVGRNILSDMCSPQHAGSVVSAVSDGTVAQSDFSTRGEHLTEEDDDVDAMDVDDQVSQPISDTSSIDNRSEQRSSPALSMTHLSPVKEPPILIGQLRMAVNVLTSGTCSDEGLEDATTLLLQLSRTEALTRDCILELLQEGAQEIADVLRDEIKKLLHELKAHNATHTTTKTQTQAKGSKHSVPILVNPSSSRSQPWRGRGGGGRTNNQTRRLQGFGAQQQQRRTAPKPVVYDLHLPTMATLIAKRCSQSLFLRVLKVILQLREAAKKNAKKPSSAKNGAQNPRSRGIRLIERLHHGGSSLREFVAALEADMEAMYEMIDRFGGGASSSSASPTTTSANNQASSSSSVSTSTTTTTSTAHLATGTSTTPATTTAGTSTSGGSGGGDGGGDGGGGEGSGTTNQDDEADDVPKIPEFPRLSTQLRLDDLWDVLGETLTELAETSDTNAVLVLQPAVEAFFLVHGSDKDEEKNKENATTTSFSQQSLDIPPSPGPYSPGSAPSPSSSSRLGSVSSLYVSLPPDTQKFLRFAETHRTVLNQILRQSSGPLTDGPFAVLVNHTRLLDFDVKRRYFRQELEKEDKGHRREDMAVHIRREHVFEDSYRELHRRTPEELKNRLYIVFDGEEGQDAGGLLREWYGIMAREMFNPNYALFTVSQGEKATYLPNRNSHCNPNHLLYFKFAGRIVAKAIYDNKLLDCYFTRSFYKHILGKPVHYTDMEAEDYGFYQGLVYLLEHDIDELGYELTFSLEMQVFGLNEVHDLKTNGRNIPVTEETKREYVKLVCREKMTGSIRKQIDSFLEGFYEIIPRRLISIFDEQELELFVAGLPTIDIEDLKANTEYHKYTDNSLQIQWFWRALRSFDQADRAKFLQFVTGTSKVPLQGFATLEGMNGVQKFQIHRDDRSTERLPCAHTCFNQLDLPAYETYDKLNEQLTKAIHECPEGFGLA